MGRITSLFARKVVAQVGGPVDVGALLATVGLEGGADVDPSFMIRDEDYYTLFERAAAADPDATTLPLRVGASMRSDDYGLLGFAWKSAPTRTTSRCSCSSGSARSLRRSPPSASGSDP